MCELSSDGQTMNCRNSLSLTKGGSNHSMRVFYIRRFCFLSGKTFTMIIHSNRIFWEIFNTLYVTTKVYNVAAKYK